MAPFSAGCTETSQDLIAGWLATSGRRASQGFARNRGVQIAVPEISGDAFVEIGGGHLAECRKQPEQAGTSASSIAGASNRACVSAEPDMDSDSIAEAPHRTISLGSPDRVLVC